MGLYQDRVLPRLVDLCCGMLPAEHRERACAGLAGEVVEVGFGSGLNVAHYPAGVTRVLAVEPSDVAFRQAGDRIAASPVPVERVGLEAERLPLPDASVDAALSTWTMCTIPDLDTALAELRRVLRPGGRLHFVEHGLSPDDGVARWQRRLNGLQMRLAGGCHIDRPIARAVEAAGFRLERLETGYVMGAPNPWGYLYEGTAVAP